MLVAGKFCNVADRSIFDLDVVNSCGMSLILVNLRVNIFVYVSKNRRIFADNTVAAFQRLCVPTRRRAADDLRIDSSFARDRFRNRRR